MVGLGVRGWKLGQVPLYSHASQHAYDSRSSCSCVNTRESKKILEKVTSIIASATCTASGRHTSFPAIFLLVEGSSYRPEPLSEPEQLSNHRRAGLGGLKVRY